MIRVGDGRTPVSAGSGATTHLLDDAERFTGEVIEAEPADLQGHWYMVATSFAARSSQPRTRWAQFIVGAPAADGQRSLLQSQKYGRDLRYAGRLTQEFCGSGLFSWHGVLWRLPLPRSHWRMTVSREGDLLCLRHSGSVALRAVTIVMARAESSDSSVRAELSRNLRQLGLSVREAAGLHESPRPPARSFADARVRWEILRTSGLRAGSVSYR